MDLCRAGSQPIEANSCAYRELCACEEKAALFPGKIWGHKTTTEHIGGLGKPHPDSAFRLEAEALPQVDGVDELGLFAERTASIKTIFILRDGRTCVRSKVARTGMSVEDAIRNWKYCVRALIVLHARIEAFHLVKMEDLVRYPEATLRSVCVFLQIPYSDTMLDGTQSSRLRAEYRRPGFDLFTIDASGIKEPWVPEISEELAAYGYAVADTKSVAT